MSLASPPSSQAWLSWGGLREENTSGRLGRSQSHKPSSALTQLCEWLWFCSHSPCLIGHSWLGRSKEILCREIRARAAALPWQRRGHRRFQELQPSLMGMQSFEDPALHMTWPKVPIPHNKAWVLSFSGGSMNHFLTSFLTLGRS